MEFETSFGRPSQLPVSDLMEIAFAGRSNVGKSSCINKLFNRKALARVSSMPGKTTTINFFRVENVRFADLPGYGYAKVSKSEKQRWKGLMEVYFTSERRLELVFLLLDMRHPPTQDDLVMLNFLVETETPLVVILTKLDKLTKTQREQRLRELQTEIPYAEDITMIPFSAKTGEGADRILEIITDIAADERE